MSYRSHLGTARTPNERTVVDGQSPISGRWIVRSPGPTRELWVLSHSKLLVMSRISMAILKQPLCFLVGTGVSRKLFHVISII